MSKQRHRIFDCIDQNRLDLVKEILSDDNFDVNQKSEDVMFFDTPLTYSVTFGRLEIVKELLKHTKIDVNKKGNFRLPIEWACKNGYVEMVQELLYHPNIDVKVGEFYRKRHENIEALFDNWKPLRCSTYEENRNLRQKTQIEEMDEEM